MKKQKQILSPQVLV